MTVITKQWISISYVENKNFKLKIRHLFVDIKFSRGLTINKIRPSFLKVLRLQTTFVTFVRVSHWTFLKSFERLTNTAQTIRC